MNDKHTQNYKKIAACIISLCIIIIGAILAFRLLNKPSSAEGTQSASDMPETMATEESSPSSENDPESNPQPASEETAADIITKVEFDTENEIDLNGDGVAETVSAAIKSESGYDPIPELTISGKTFDSTYLRDNLSFYTTNPRTDYYYFLDLDTSDPYVEIAFFDYGPSDDPYTFVLRYTDDKLILLGGFTAAADEPPTVIPGDGTVHAVTTCEIIQTDWTMAVWKLTGEELEMQELTEGEFLAYQSRYGSDYPITAKRDFQAFFADPLSSAVASVKEGTEVAIQSFKKSEDSDTITIYFFYKDENGDEQHACFNMEEGDPYKVLLPNEETTSLELFEGLGFAG